MLQETPQKLNGKGRKDVVVEEKQAATAQYAWYWPRHLMPPEAQAAVNRQSTRELEYA